MSRRKIVAIGAALMLSVAGLTVGGAAMADDEVVWNDSDKDVAVSVPGTESARTNASGVKIPSNAHSTDLPGIYFHWDPKQKSDGYLKVCPPTFDTYSSFTFTAKESKRYWDYSIAPQPDQEMTDDGCYVFFIPIRDKNINMTFVVDIQTGCPEGQIQVDGVCTVEPDCDPLEDPECCLEGDETCGQTEECDPLEDPDCCLEPDGCEPPCEGEDCPCEGEDCEPEECDPAEDPECCPDGVLIDGVCLIPCDPETDPNRCETPQDFECEEGETLVGGECIVVVEGCEEGFLLVNDDCVPVIRENPEQPPVPLSTPPPAVAKNLAFTGTDYSLYAALALSLGLMGVGQAMRRRSSLTHSAKHRA